MRMMTRATMQHNMTLSSNDSFGILMSSGSEFQTTGPETSGGARDSMLPGHSQVNYSANQVKRKSRNTMPPCH